MNDIENKPEVHITEEGYFLFENIGLAEKYLGKSWWTKNREKEIQEQKKNGTFGIEHIAIIYDLDIFNDKNKHYLGNPKYFIKNLKLSDGRNVNVVYDMMDWIKLENANEDY